MTIEFLIKISDVDEEKYDELEVMDELEESLNIKLTEEEASIKNVESMKSPAAAFVFSVIVAPAIGAVVGEVTKKIIKEIFRKMKEKSKSKNVEVKMRDDSGSTTFKTGTDDEIKRKSPYYI
ncbi:MAG: hypothetical protein ACFFAU_10240 [Candidatus Hodarchaeota archaeon]